MESCARGALLSGVGFLVSLKWLQARGKIRRTRRGFLETLPGMYECTYKGA